VHDALDSCSARRQAKAIREHSAIARCPDNVVEAEDERLDLVLTSGELDTLSKVCTRRGEWGRELDLRKLLRAEGFLRLVDEGGRRITGCDFAGVLRAASVPLMTTVANRAFSLGESSNLDCFTTSRRLAWVVFGPVLGAFLSFVCVDNGAFTLAFVRILFG
jgi:hypothetical protein